MFENQRDMMSAQCFNVEQTAFAIDSVKDTQTTVAAMKSATKTLKAENKKININDIEEMQDDLAGIVIVIHYTIHQYNTLYVYKRFYVTLQFPP